MRDVVIELQGIGKRYELGRAVVPTTFREAVAAVTRSPLSRWRRTSGSGAEFWALRDIDLCITRGEAVAVIGRNGAGKSTLLKVLSRITEPTDGRGRVKGRVGSLLEVGTGFHPELTGRENIYLNGAILGMTRADIRRRFDEIVSYAEVERFLDTPVKRYSSGMYMRLAFAVAAHLEPDILVVDEVLAVGDAGFQKKCLGKMSAVARQGRTVLFVSHNMSAVRVLCERGILLEQGRVAHDGLVDSTIQAYLSHQGAASTRSWRREAPARDRPLTIESVEAGLEGAQPRHLLRLDVSLASHSPHPPAFIAADILDPLGGAVMQALPTPVGFISADAPRHRLRLEVDLPGLIPGEYGVTIWVGSHNTETLDEARGCVIFEVTRSPTDGRTFPHSPDHGFMVPSSRVTILPEA